MAVVVTVVMVMMIVRMAMIVVVAVIVTVVMPTPASIAMRVVMMMVVIMIVVMMMIVRDQCLGELVLDRRRLLAAAAYILDGQRHDLRGETDVIGMAEVVATQPPSPV